jgi:hypothetical protein
MKKDKRDVDRIRRALETRNVYEELKNPIIDTTQLTIEETVDKAINIINTY